MTNPDELERLARAATPGPWDIPENNPFGDGRHVFADGLDGTRFVVTNCKTDQTFVTATNREQQQHNAAFIAAANPATILALLSANREMREALEPFALAADNMDGDEPDSLFIYDSPESTMISYGDLRKARSALTTQRGDGE